MFFFIPSLSFIPVLYRVECCFVFASKGKAAKAEKKHTHTHTHSPSRALFSSISSSSSPPPRLFSDAMNIQAVIPLLVVSLASSSSSFSSPLLFLLLLSSATCVRASRSRHAVQPIGKREENERKRGEEEEDGEGRRAGARLSVCPSVCALCCLFVIRN